MIRQTADIARLHMASLTDSNLNPLGTGMVARYYRHVASSPKEKLFIEERKGQVAGACVLSLEPGTLTRRYVITHAVPFAFSAALTFLFSPSGRGRLLRAMLANNETPAAVRSLPEVVQIFSAERFRGQGVGTKLLQQTESFLKVQGVSSYMLKTSAAEGNAAHDFYRKKGFSKAAEARYNGERFTFLVKRLG